MTLHSEMDMAWELGAAIELVQPERLGDRNSERLAPTQAIQISTLFDPRIRALPCSGAPGLAGWPSLLSVPRMQKSLVRFSKPELLSFDAHYYMDGFSARRSFCGSQEPQAD